MKKPFEKIYNVNFIADEAKTQLKDHSMEGIERFIDTMLIPTSVGSNATYGEVNEIRKRLIKSVYLRVHRINDYQ